MVVANAAVGLWALAAHRDERFGTRWLWWCTAVAQLTVFVQVVLGVIVIQGRTDEDFGFHVLYGFSTAFAVAIIYSYRHQLAEKVYLLYGLGGLFIAGLGLRAMTIVSG